MTIYIRTAIVFILFCVYSNVCLAGIEEDILFHTNKYRKQKGKPALQLHPSINKQALQHSKNMASGKSNFGHDGFKKRTSAIKQEMGSFSSATENVAYGKLNAEDVVKLWIKSATHRKNLLGNYQYLGVGVANNQKKGVRYFTQIFIEK